jgi:hypothetical protein
VRGEEVPNTIDLTPKLQKAPSATRDRTARGVHPQQRQRRGKPNQGSETSGETCALEGGPKHNRSTTHDAKEPKPMHDSAIANHGNGVDRRDRNEPEKTQPLRTTPKKKINPKNPERKWEREEDVRIEEKRKGRGKRQSSSLLPWNLEDVLSFVSFFFMWPVKN